MDHRRKQTQTERRARQRETQLAAAAIVAVVGVAAVATAAALVVTFISGSEGSISRWPPNRIAPKIVVKVVFRFVVVVVALSVGVSWLEW